MKKAIVLAGGNDQIELIKGIRKRYIGIEVILIDMVENVRARAFADKHFIISTMDFKAVLEVSRKEGIDLIIVACGDQPLITMAYVSEELRLPCYLTYNQALNLTNKICMKDLMLKNGIRTAKYEVVNTGQNMDMLELNYPLVVKPADNNGSKGIVKVYNKQQLLEAIDEAKKYSVSGGLLVEEFKEGEEYSVEAFILKGKPYIIIATKNIKIKDNNNRFTILQNEYINNLSKVIEYKILETIEQIGKGFCLDNTPLLIQMIVKDNDLNVIEFSARTGGGSKMFFIKEMVGVDVIENLLDITDGKVPNITTKPSKQFASVNYIYTEPCIFSSVENLDQLMTNGYITEFYMYKQLGARINSSNYSSDRPAGFLVKANTEQELREKIQYIDSHLQILNENGEDVMRHGIYH